MSLTRIKKAFEQVKDTQFAFVDEEILELMSALAEHIIVLGSEHEETPLNKEECISLVDFEKRYKFIAANTLCHYCNNDEAFVKSCAYRHGNKWKVHPEATLEYLKRLPKFKKRLERLGSNC